MKITAQDLALTMVSKTITFDYNGGTYTQELKIRGTNLPWRYECDCKWIVVATAATSLTVNIQKTYDFNTRVGVVKIFDRFGNEINLVVEQTGYYDLSIECPTSVVLPYTYYNTNTTYDIYVTVYGGPTQEVNCKKITTYLNKVWDNSDMYNDFMVTIPQSLEGEFTIKHSDWKAFKDFCKKNDIPYPKDKLEKKLSIQQVSADDMVGEMVIDCNGRQYTNNDANIVVEIGVNSPVIIKIVSCKYTAVTSRTKCVVNEDKKIEIDNCPVWVDSAIDSDIITLTCKEENHFNDRTGTFKISNTNNSRQNITIQLKQKSGT